MDTNFLNALKTKSQVIDSNLKKNIPIAKPQPTQLAKVINDYKDGNYTVIGEGTDKLIDSKHAILTGLEIVINRNRLDVYFDIKPTNYQRNLLVTQGFRCRKEANDDGSINYTWYHQNSEDNQKFLRDNFRTISPDFWDIEDPKLEIVDPLASADETFREYVRKVNALSAHLKVDAADLTIKAIDCLYDVTFNS